MEPVDVTSQSLGDLCKVCAEYRQNSPHPSRPLVPKLVDSSVWLRVHSLFQTLGLRLEHADGSGVVAQCSEALECLCIFVRNAAAMEKANQTAASEYEIVNDVKDAIVAMAARELECAEAMRCGTAAAQALSNLVTGNKQLQQELMENELLTSDNAKDSVYWHLLSSISSKTSMAGLVLLLNSIKGNSELAQHLCSTDKGKLVAQKIGQMFGDNEDDESEAKTIIYVLLAQFIETGYLANLLSEAPTLDMFGLVEALAVYCNEAKDHKAILDAAGGYTLLLSLSSILKSVHKVLEGVWDRKSADSSGSGIETDRLVSTHRAMSATLSALGSLTTDCSAETTDQMIRSEVLHRVVELLGLLNKHLPRIESASAQQSKTSDSASEDTASEQLFMFKRDLIRIIGNLAHKHTVAQNLIRDLDGLALVLDHMKIDDNHPFIKEYAIVALNSLMQDNAENQEFIRKMDNRGVAADQNSKLAFQGLI
ncbi:Ataxin-10 [Coemansia sp. RSA 1722]|nr:Ataxin-10 [Coemansia sp. RSA 485]KAJ2595144.1 Ataxin-10 [Coemansia sp. RSA 1722]